MAKDNQTRKARAQQFHASHAARKAELYVPRPTATKLVHTPGMCQHQQGVIRAWDECAKPKDNHSLVEAVRALDPKLKPGDVKIAANQLMQSNFLARVEEDGVKRYVPTKKGREARQELA